MTGLPIPFSLEREAVFFPEPEREVFRRVAIFLSVGNAVGFDAGARRMYP